MKTILCGGWREYKRDCFIRYDQKCKVWVTMCIYYFFPNGRIYSQGETSRQAQKALSSAIKLYQEQKQKEPR